MNEARKALSLRRGNIHALSHMLSEGSNPSTKTMARLQEVYESQNKKLNEYMSHRILS